MNDHDSAFPAVGVIVLLCYATFLGVMAGRWYEKRERERRELRSRVNTLEVLTGPQQRVLLRRDLDMADQFDPLAQPARQGSDDGT